MLVTSEKAGKRGVMTTEYYSQKLQQGLEYQDFISDELGIPFYSSKKYQNDKGESKIGIEIKFDDRYAETGNLYIETHEKTDASNNDWVVSGINRKDNTCIYLIGNFQNAFMFSKKTLLKLQQLFRSVETPTSKGYLIPQKDISTYSIKDFTF